MREFEADAEAKAGFELKKAAEKRAALDQALVEARELCKAAGKDFKAFHETLFPTISERVSIRFWRSPMAARRPKAFARKSVSESDGSAQVSGTRAMSRTIRPSGQPLSYPQTEAARGQSLRRRPRSRSSRCRTNSPRWPPARKPQSPDRLRSIAEARKAADDAVRAGETPPGDEAPTTGNGHTANVKPDDDRSLAEKLHSALNDVWSLCQDQNNWSHLNEDQKVELRGGMTKLGYLRELLPRLATPTVH